MSLCSQTPNATSGYGTLSLYTWSSSGSHIGTKNYTFYLDVPSSVKPTISTVALSDPNGYLDKYGGYVQTKSKVQVKTTASGVYSSTIKNIYVNTGSGYTSGGSDYTSSELLTSGAISVNVYATDSRGRSSDTTTKTITVLPYSQPAISAASAYRCDKDGTSNDGGEYVCIAYDYSVAPLNSKNTAKATIEYRRSTDSSGSWTTLTTLSDYSADSSIITDAMSNDYQWDIRLTVQDDFGSTQYTVIAPSAAVIMDILTTGDGVAFGKTAEHAEVLDCAWPIMVEGVELDYIVAQGTSGNWTYRVWKSGHREAWGYYNVPYANSNVFWGSISLPSSGYQYTFATLTDYGSNASTALKWNVKAYCSSAGNAARVYVHRPDGGGTSGSTMRVYLYAFG